MGKHLNPLEKEFLNKKYKGNPTIKLSEFCKANDISDTAMRKWIKQYEDENGETFMKYKPADSFFVSAGKKEIIIWGKGTCLITHV